MRVFVYEYICGGGLAGQPLPESLRREGWAMLRAVVEDFARCPGVEVVTLLDRRLADTDELRATQIDLVCPGTEAACFEPRAAAADFTLVIAPETNEVLWQRCCWVEHGGGRLLGTSSRAAAATGNKASLEYLWQRADVPTPATFGIEAAPAEHQFPLVCKPIWGTGSQGITLVRTAAEFRTWCEAHPGWEWREIVQPYVPGKAVSVSLIVGTYWTLALPAATQHLSDDGRFRYLGGSVPLPDDLNDRAQRLALRAIAPVDGLSGYVGVDLILGDAADGSEDFAIEINPRLTTSYVGLRALAEFNLAETMLAMALGQPLPERRYREGPVRWSADGTVQ